MFSYLIAANNLKVGDIIKSDIEAQAKIGHITTLKNVALGCPIFNIVRYFAFNIFTDSCKSESY